MSPAIQPLAEHPRCPCCGHEFKALPRIDAMIAALGLVGLQKRLLTILATGRGRYLTTKEIAHVLYEVNEGGGASYAEKVVRISISELREKLSGYGLRIEGLRANGGGYRLWAIETAGHQGGYQLIANEAA